MKGLLGKIAGPSILEFQLSFTLKGEKYGVKKGNMVFVSPAVYKLVLMSESDEELTHLLRHVEVLEVSDD